MTFWLGSFNICRAQTNYNPQKYTFFAGVLYQNGNPWQQQILYAQFDDIDMGDIVIWYKQGMGDIIIWYNQSVLFLCCLYLSWEIVG